MKKTMYFKIDMTIYFQESWHEVVKKDTPFFVVGKHVHKERVYYVGYTKFSNSELGSVGNELTVINADYVVEYRTLTDEFDVRDALRGKMSGDYDKDFKRLMKAGCVCSAELYNEAFQISSQP